MATYCTKFHFSATERVW